MFKNLYTRVNLLTILFVIINQLGYSQIVFGDEQVIDQAIGFVHVHTGDLDGDGDEDAVACGFGKLIWYENDGLGGFINTQVIVSGEGSMQSIYITDLDGDDDLDILTESNQGYPVDNDQVVWFKNDGSGNFGSKIIITDQINTGHCVFASDLDGDGDSDVLSASVYDDKIAWYENVGNGSFGTQQIISSTTDGASTVYASDIDGDGDNDIIAGGAWDNTLSWYENIDGQGTFGSENLISTTVDLIQFAYTADLDGDYDQDVYFAAMGNNKIAWYQNDGNGNFGSLHLIDYETNATDVFAQDFDNDNDLDIVSTADAGTLSWFENNGTGEFGEQIIISSNDNRSVYSADLNGDNKNDILTASYYQEKLSWYVNTGTAGMNQNLTTDFSIYPNPAFKYLTIQSDAVIKELKIFNSFGQIYIYVTDTSKVNISNLNSGIYMVKVTDIYGNIGVKKIIKK